MRRQSDQPIGKATPPLASPGLCPWHHAMIAGARTCAAAGPIHLPQNQCLANFTWMRSTGTPCKENADAWHGLEGAHLQAPRRGRRVSGAPQRGQRMWTSVRERHRRHQPQGSGRARERPALSMHSSTQHAQQHAACRMPHAACRMPDGTCLGFRQEEDDEDRPAAMRWVCMWGLFCAPVGLLCWQHRWIALGRLLR